MQQKINLREVARVANENNLIPFSKKSVREARESGAKGGKKSAETRRKKKLLKDRMKALLELPVNDFDDYNEASAMGVNLDDIDNETVLVIKLFQEAKKGNVNAFKEIRNLIGQDLATEEMALKKKELELKEKLLQKADSPVSEELPSLFKALESDEQ